MCRGNGSTCHTVSRTFKEAEGMGMVLAAALRMCACNSIPCPCGSCLVPLPPPCLACIFILTAVSETLCQVRPVLLWFFYVTVNGL